MGSYVSLLYRAVPTSLIINPWRKVEPPRQTYSERQMKLIKMYKPPGLDSDEDAKTV
jgi:hypothetical protein